MLVPSVVAGVVLAKALLALFLESAFAVRSVP